MNRQRVAGETACLPPAFERWFLIHGQEAAARLDYVPLPNATVKLIERYWQKQLGA